MPPAKLAVKAHVRLQDYIAYRREELQFEEREIQANAGYGIGGGAIVSRGERLRVITIMLGELEKLAAWLEAGEPVYVPPLSAEDKRHWRWVRDRHMEVPPHILEQLS